MNRYYRLGFIVLTAILAACSSGKQAYERGDYYDAVMKSITRLRQNPDHKKSRETLKHSYPLAVQWLDNSAKNQIASNANFKYRSALQAYEQINAMGEAIRQSPGALSVVPDPKSYYNEIADLKQKAAEESYEAGINALLKGDRVNARAAYYNFSDVQQFVPGYKDVIEYLDKSLDEATLKVVLEQIPVPRSYDLSGGFFQEKVEEFLHNNYSPQQNFIRFYTPREAEALRIPDVDQILRIQFDDFTVGNTRILEKEETVEKDSVVIGETKDKEKVYATVKAKLTTFRKEVTSNGVLSMTVVDAVTGGVLSSNKFPGQYVWWNTWGHFNGDERALTEEQLAMTKRKEIQPPPPQQLFLEFTKPIYDQLIPSLRRFYAGY